MSCSADFRLHAALLRSGSLNISRSFWHMNNVEKERERNSTSVASPNPSDFTSPSPSLSLSLFSCSFHTHTDTMQSHSFTVSLSLSLSLTHTHTHTHTLLVLLGTVPLSKNVRCYNPEGIHHQRLPRTAREGLHADTSDEWRLDGETKRPLKF